MKERKDPSSPLQHYLSEEAVVSYLDVRRRVRDSLKHVYLADRPKGAQCPMGPERGRERRLSDKETCIIIVSLQIFMTTTKQML